MIYFFEKMPNFRAVLIVLLLLLYGCYDNHSKPPTEPFAVKANEKIESLRQLCRNGYYNISTDVVCVGKVTSSDKAGNFYRSMFVEDDTGAIEVKLGTYNIASRYPIGLTVALHLMGTSIMLKDDILQVGLPPQSYDTAPREFEAQEVIDQHIVRSNSVEAINPLTIDIPTLSTSLCGRFVRVSGIHYAPSANEISDGYYRFMDGADSAVFIYISPYANFTTIELPSSDTTIQGILCYEAVGGGYGRQFVIKPRFADDITPIESDM